MFNWFKSKVELKNEKCIMSSADYKRGLKIGSEIIVPDNFECLIYNKGKLFNTLSTGKHVIEKYTFDKLIQRQQKNRSKIKRVGFVAHFVSLSTQQIEFTYKKSKYIVSFTVSDATQFADLMLLYAYKVDNHYVYSYLAEIFEELLIDCGCNEAQIAEDVLKDYGITIESFKSNTAKVSILHATSLSQTSPQKEKQVKPQEENPTSAPSAQPQTTPPPSASQEPQTSTRTTIKANTTPPCPRCGNVCKFKTTYCLKCGHKLE